MLFEEAWGWSLPSLPAAVADWASLVVIVCGIFFLLRRLARPEVRILTSAWDYTVILLALAPLSPAGWPTTNWAPTALCSTCTFS